MITAGFPREHENHIQAFANESSPSKFYYKSS